MKRYDPRPPRILLLSPTASADTIVRASGRRLTIEGLVASWTGISDVQVAGRTATLLGEAATQRSLEGDAPLSGPSRRFHAELDLPRHGAVDVDVRVRDDRGRESVTRLQVAAPVDSLGPVVTFSVQGRPAEGDTLIRVAANMDRVRLQGVASDRSGVESVRLDGAPVAVELESETRDLSPVDRRYTFDVGVNLAPGRSTATVLVRDSLGHETERQVCFERPLTAVTLEPAPPSPVSRFRPGIEILEPREWRGGGLRGLAVAARSSIPVIGRVRYERGVSEVLINGVRAAMSPEPTGISWRFSGFAAVAADTREVEITAVGTDGALASRLFSVQPEAAGTQSMADLQGRRWAVIIGVSDYLDPSIPDLRFADEDARSVYDFLRSERAGLGGIPESNIRLLIDEDASYRNIRSSLLTFLQNSTPDDLIFVYLAGHGAPNPHRPDDLYLLAHDTELADIAATGIPMVDVADALNRAYARNKVLFSDACHSAGMGVGGARSLELNRINTYFLESMTTSSGGFVSFTASEVNQLSREGEQWGGHGIFTYYLLEGLRGAADADGDHIVTLGEVMEYTRDRVRRGTQNDQIPTISQTSFDRYWPMAIVPEG